MTRLPRALPSYARTPGGNPAGTHLIIENRRRIVLPKEIDRAILPPSIVPSLRRSSGDSCASAAVCPCGRVDDVLRLRFRSAYQSRWPRPPSSGGSVRSPSRVTERGATVELGYLRLSAVQSLASSATSRLAWERDGSTPGRFRPMYATHDFVFKVGQPFVSAHSAMRPTHRETSGFTPECRFGELASACGRFFPPLRLERTSDASSPRGQFVGARRD
jgi:hypothetical protein